MMNPDDFISQYKNKPIELSISNINVKNIVELQKLTETLANKDKIFIILNKLPTTNKFDSIIIFDSTETSSEIENKISIYTTNNETLIQNDIETIRQSFKDISMDVANIAKELSSNITKLTRVIQNLPSNINDVNNIYEMNDISNNMSILSNSLSEKINEHYKLYNS